MRSKKKLVLFIGILAIICGVLIIFFVLKNPKALLIHPKGIIAQKELHLIKTNISLMLIIVIPTLILLLWTAWRYHSKNVKENHGSKHHHHAFSEIILWIFPSAIIATMGIITWKHTQELDPYKPIESERKALTVQVVALDWKWLFIYPEQGIATINFIQIPAQTPIHFELASDGSPMNSFWIPELSGQIYAMAGMKTTIYMMADQPGVFTGRAAEINGKGFADMTFLVKSSSQSEFNDWIMQVKRSPKKLTHSTYNELVKPSEKNPVVFYSFIEKNLFNKIMMKYLIVPSK